MAVFTMVLPPARQFDRKRLKHNKDRDNRYCMILTSRIFGKRDLPRLRLAGGSTILFFKTRVGKRLAEVEPLPAFKGKSRSAVLSGVIQRIPSDLCSMTGALTFQSASRIAGAIIRVPDRCWINAPWKARSARIGKMRRHYRPVPCSSEVPRIILKMQTSISDTSHSADSTCIVSPSRIAPIRLTVTWTTIWSRRAL